ncbi:GtrA family protein [Paraburkholderia heleia]|uniref:GtrA family protein n=1 Tax=Paraburkholderia heleia TaxID=634127 RepID=UPI0031CE83DB
MTKLRVSPRFVRFLVVGGLNTALGYGVYVLLALTLTHSPTWAILILTNVVTISLNFFTTGGLVFRDIRISRLPTFLVVYGLIVFLYSVLIGWLSPVVGGRIQAMTLIVLPMSALTYLLQSRVVFRRPDQASNRA